MARILLAEDDTSMREFLARALERNGHTVVAVPDGLAALHEVHERAFELLIADIVMPGMDGIELSRQASRSCPDLKNLIITGFAAVAMNAQQTMSDAKVLSKPFHPRELVDNVDRILAH